MIRAFTNEPVEDFTVEVNRNKMVEALKQVKEELGKEYPLIINGEKVFNKENQIKSVNPSKKTEVVGYVSKASKEQAEEAIQTAHEKYKIWKNISSEVRADYLFKAAAIMRRKKFYYSAWLVYEVGKNWTEAAADVAEAIDFFEYYARQIIDLNNTDKLTQHPKEKNSLQYIGLGVGAVIPPWNFAIAILAGMTSAAIVSGNTVILKPSSDSPVCGAKIAELFEEAGLPDGILNFLPGSGAEIGDYIVEHPKTRFISFTGSMEIGLRITELASKKHKDQIWIKRVISELGGKNAIIVDESADLECAAEGIVAGAFGFQGQKCSACSRVIAHEAIHDELLAKCIELTKRLKSGDPSEDNYIMGAVINEKSLNKFKEYVEIGIKEEAKLECGGGVKTETGFYPEPTIFSNAHPNSRLMQEEIFAPITAFTKVKSFDEAIHTANSTIYGLTGAVYTRNRAHIELAAAEFHVGNLYINRKNTGALVGVHPFGGFNMSGTDSKAGGPDYLLLFTQPKTVSELL